MICFDEQSRQLLTPTRAPIPVCSGHPRREDPAYKRTSTRNLCMFAEPKAGKRHTLVSRRRTKRDVAYAMRYLVDCLYPHANCIDVVLDTLITHTYLALVETFGKTEADRIAAPICFHFTVRMRVRPVIHQSRGYNGVYRVFAKRVVGKCR